MSTSLTAAHLKAKILTAGVTFTPAALRRAKECGAKSLQWTYNAPAGALSGAPQELILSDADGYSCCASAVAPVPGRSTISVDVVDGRLIAVGCEEVGVDFVRRPAYYDRRLASGQAVTRLVSMCGANELNIWPWHDCAIGQLCRFCGVNAVFHKVGEADLTSAREIGRMGPAPLLDRIDEVAEAVRIAAVDPAYDAALYPMIISGNLPGKDLDDQARLYMRIAEVVSPLVVGRSGAEGLVATTAPPRDLGLLRGQRDAGIRTMAINLEAYSAEAFRLHCPGKHNLGRDFYLRALDASVGVYGAGFVWTNLILGLEPLETLLAGCKSLAFEGIVPGVSVLHLDEGATLRNVVPPTYEETLWFYRQLAEIYVEFGLRPYFDSLALRSSLANEAFNGRF